MSLSIYTQYSHYIICPNNHSVQPPHTYTKHYIQNDQEQVFLALCSTQDNIINNLYVYHLKMNLVCVDVILYHHDHQMFHLHSEMFYRLQAIIQTTCAITTTAAPTAINYNEMVLKTSTVSSSCDCPLKLIDTHEICE